MNAKVYSIGLLISGLILSCGSPTETKEVEAMPESREQSTGDSSKKELTLIALENDKGFAEARLSLESEDAKQLKEGMHSFDFSLNGFELGAQTNKQTGLVLANSAKGQHIHFIVNNGPYSARYQTSF